MRYLPKTVGYDVSVSIVGYEIVGLENIPAAGKGALMAYYHGVMPMDVFFAAVAIFNHCGRVLGGTAHKFIFSIPLVGGMLRVCTEISVSRPIENISLPDDWNFERSSTISRALNPSIRSVLLKFFLTHPLGMA